MKRFSPMKDTQRGSQSYMKKRRGRKEIEMSRRRKRGTRGERQIYAVVCSQSSLWPRLPQRFTELDLEEKRKGGNRGVLRQKMESQDWERVFNTLLNKNGN